MSEVFKKIKRRKPYLLKFAATWLRAMRRQKFLEKDERKIKKKNIYLVLPLPGCEGDERA